MAELEIAGLAEELRKSLGATVAKLMSGATFSMGFSFPISKIDSQKREVTGVATSESIDSSGEILDYQASKQAFAGWQKNIREMHGPVACGRAVDVVMNDAAKSIAITARISKGAPDTWTKVLDGTLRCFSVGGTRLRSEIRSDGIRRTTEWKLNEISLVDVGANPDTAFSLVKSLSGRPVVSELVALDVEADYSNLADALDAVSRQLSAKCRPLAAEVSKALRLAGSGIVCDQVAPDDFSQRGRAIAADLSACSAVLRGASALEDLEKARTSAGFVLRALCSRRDLQRALKRGSAEATGVTLESLREEIAKALGQLRGVEGAGEAVEILEKNVMQVQGVAHAARAVQKSIFTRQELEQARDTLAAKLQEWQASGRPRTPEYHTLEGQYFIAVERLKSVR